jgi:type VI protein secretion system component Hcp
MKATFSHVSASATVNLNLPGTTTAFLTYALSGVQISGYVQNTRGTAVSTDAFTLVVQSITETSPAMAGNPTAAASAISGDITIPGQTAVPITLHQWGFQAVASSGQVSGGVHSDAFVVKRPLDSLASTFSQALAQNAPWTTVTINLNQPGMTITLSNVRVSSVTDSADGTVGGIPTQEIQMLFDKLSVVSGGTTTCLAFYAVIC